MVAYRTCPLAKAVGPDVRTALCVNELAGNQTIRLPANIAPCLRSPLPTAWTIDENHACFIIRDNNGKALGYFYFED